MRLDSRLVVQRSQLAIVEALEKVCHLNRYEYQSPLNPTKREETSRNYGGLAPPIMANACKKVVDAWQDDDEYIESTLVAGGSPDRLHEEVRKKVCAKLCKGEATVALEVQGEKLVSPDQEKCEDPDAKGKKKKKKPKRNQFGELAPDDEDDAPSYKVH